MRGLASFSVLAMTAAALVGLAAGIGGYTFLYAQGASYLTNRPEACANCHVMSDQLNGWMRSSHRRVAVCNDCHTPHSFFGKYATKAKNGFWHSFAFTTGRFEEPIRMHEANREVTERACRGCHEALVHLIDTPGGGESLSCIRCHAEVGHP